MVAARRAEQRREEQTREKGTIAITNTHRAGNIFSGDKRTSLPRSQPVITEFFPARETDILPSVVLGKYAGRPPISGGFGMGGGAADWSFSGSL